MNNASRVGLICALPQEIAHLKAAMADVRTVVTARWAFAMGRLEGREVAVVNAGMGKVHSALVTSLLIEKFGCKVVVMSGVAGGLDPHLRIGDVVLAERVVQHDTGVIENGALSTYQPGHVPFINPTKQLGYAVSADLLARVRERLADYQLPGRLSADDRCSESPRITYGTILTGDQFVHCEFTRIRLHTAFGAQAVDMEGGAVAQACATFDVPWLIIRALSDLAGSNSGLDFQAFSAAVAAASALILRRLLPVL
jgi:adenosylhomocysteine nucleosidase